MNYDAIINELCNCRRSDGVFIFGPLDPSSATTGATDRVGAHRASCSTGGCSSSCRGRRSSKGGQKPARIVVVRELRLLLMGIPEDDRIIVGGNRELFELLALLLHLLSGDGEDDDGQHCKSELHFWFRSMKFSKACWMQLSDSANEDELGADSAPSFYVALHGRAVVGAVRIIYS